MLSVLRNFLFDLPPPPPSSPLPPVVLYSCYCSSYHCLHPHPHHYIHILLILLSSRFSNFTFWFLFFSLTCFSFIHTSLPFLIILTSPLFIPSYQVIILSIIYYYLMFFLLLTRKNSAFIISPPIFIYFPFPAVPNLFASPSTLIAPNFDQYITSANVMEPRGEGEGGTYVIGRRESQGGGETSGRPAGRGGAGGRGREGAEHRFNNGGKIMRNGMMGWREILESK